MTIKKVVSKPVKTSTKTNTSTDKPRGKKDVFEILDGQVKIYRTNSKVWQYQLWIKEEQKYVRESLQTDDKESAVNKATERFIYYRSRILKNEKVFSITSSELRDDFLIYIQNQVDNQQLSKGRQSNIKTFTKHYLKFVNEKSKIQNIPPKFFRDYLTFRRTSKSDILVSVVINESVTIKQMYRFGVDKGHINSDYCPDFGVMKKPQDEGIRDSFTIDEYGMLINISKNWYKDKSISDNEEEKYYRRLCNDFILVMANGGFRTQEVRLLKWKDIKKISETDKGVYAEVVVRAENTKIRKSRTLEMRRGDVFQRIKGY